MTQKQTDPGYHIIAAIGTEIQMQSLLPLGCALASAYHGRITILTVTATGDRPEWLTVREACGDIPVSIVMRTGEDPGAEILATVRKAPPDLLLLGWRGQPTRGRYLAGRNLDAVVQYAPCDVAIVRYGADKPALDLTAKPIERVLVPTAGGPNAALAIDLAMALSPQIQVTALSVAREVHGQVALSLSHERLNETLVPWSDEPRVQGKVIQSSSVIKGILSEAAGDYDLVMIGASHESYLDRVLFGNIPQTIVSRSPVPALVVKRHIRRMLMGTWLRRTGWRLFDALPTLDLHQQTEVYKTIREGAEPKVDFFVMMSLSSAIATLGLLLNSPAVIIGAMLVAPLMSAIFGLSLGVVRGDLRLLRRAATATLRGMLLAIAVAVMLTLVVPVTTLPSEVVSRTQPSLLDLGVALVSGAAGAYAICRKEVSAALPGVAIAAALVPPLAAVGIGLAQWRGEIAGGAILLFMTNLVAISAAGGGVFLWLGFRPIPGQQKRAQIFRRGVLSTAALLVAVTIPLVILSVDLLRQAALNREIAWAVDQEVRAMDRVEWDGEWKMLSSEDHDETLRLEVQVRSQRTVAHQEVVDLQERLANRLQRTVELRLIVIPTTQLDPFVPPTPTPTPLPGSTATFTPSLTPTSTPVPTRTPAPTATPTSTPTHTPTPTPTHTPTSTPTHTPTPTHTATPTPTPTPVLAEVGGTGGLGVWMYVQPGLGGTKITAWRDGTVMIIVGGPFEADGYIWIQVMDPRGRLGWIPDRYLIRLGRPPR
jgi:uncharacterized hydrophobic protein (TIGR00271 family)